MVLSWESTDFRNGEAPANLAGQFVGDLGVTGNGFNFTVLGLDQRE